MKVDTLVKNKLKKIIIITSLIIFFLLTILLILSQTILFTWSPLRLGYNYFSFDLYDVYTKSTALESIYKNLEDIIIQTENKHKLKLTFKPEIIICNKSEMIVYLPWLRSHSAAGIWPNTIYLSKFTIDQFKNPKLNIKHELSHILLLQNYGNSSCMTIWQHNEWLPEGFAVYVTNGFPSYMSKIELLLHIPFNSARYSGNILPPVGRSLSITLLNQKWQN